MSRLPEQRLYDRAREACQGYGLWIQRLENSVASGMPDTFIMNFSGRTIWVENKAVGGWPARSNTPVLGNAKGLRTSQRAWHREALRRGAPAFVLVGVGSEVFYLPAFSREGQCVNDFNRVDFLSLAHFTSFDLFYKFAREL